MRVHQLLIYREEEEGGLLHQMAELVRQREEGRCSTGQWESPLFEFFHQLICLAESCGFRGNLWHCYLAHLLVRQENVYSRICEMQGECSGSIRQAVLHDMAIYQEFFALDLASWKPEGGEILDLILEYDRTGDPEIYEPAVSDRICALAKALAAAGDPVQMEALLTEDCRRNGAGMYGLYKAFRIICRGEEAEIHPIVRVPEVRFRDLVGYELAKKKLRENTEAFVAGRSANNCLLFGDAGTGKSSSIKALLNEYADRGLRMIELYRYQLKALPQVIAGLRGRNYKFIIYMDDLSFEEFETDYKYLKALMEGGLEKLPDNVLIYATSNRRHLIRESFADKEGRRDLLHASDTVQEKLSLVYRFGVTIFFEAPDPKLFQKIVKSLAERSGVSMSEEELLLAANQWELSHGGLSGRTARQFIDDLLGKQGEEET